MESFVISLKSATKRREHIENEFSKHNLNFSFFDAITPKNALLLADNFGLTVNSQNLTSGELACLISHISIWKKIVEEKIAHTAIFEDDIYLGEEAQFLLNNDGWIEPEWNIIKIEFFYKRVGLSSKFKKIKYSQSKIFELIGPNLGAAGYILSYEGAKASLELLNGSLDCPIDHIIFDKAIETKKVKVHQIEPALCIQEMMWKSCADQIVLTSSLCKERSLRMKKNKKRGLIKIYHEILRLIKQVRYGFLSRKVTFK